VSITNALAIGWLQRSAGSPLALVRRHATVALPAALASMASYLLILWVFLHAPVALAAALRDTSAVFAMLIAVLWLKEPLPARRVGVLVLAIAGAVMLRMA
jgi:drug/metabolite transporter (DMT)-like permease